MRWLKLWIQALDCNMTGFGMGPFWNKNLTLGISCVFFLSIFCVSLHLPHVAVITGASKGIAKSLAAAHSGH
jgi:hypothetical protein